MRPCKYLGGTGQHSKLPSAHSFYIIIDVRYTEVLTSLRAELIVHTLADGSRLVPSF